jgi:2-polyprenyl-3-methyl-5-hydroxy-6-metoxy-1,4-benzoquinol methylase/glycosyltransferase involved in cell wall biosynthesis
VFRHKVKARLRILWNQDLLVDGSMKLAIMAHAFAFDKVVYVSEFHRRQWEELVPELTPLGYVTKNGFDPALVASGVPKDPSRVIYISRPERGLRPLLAMWPLLKAKVPDATLHLCRYSSMYDAHGWGEVCKRYDQAVAILQNDVGGVVHLGELGKAALYHAIAASAVMWYPGVVDFGETSCIAAIEAQANGTPFVGSYKGALTETVPSGTLIKGDADKDEAYRTAAVDAVASLIADCRKQGFAYRTLQQAGRDHVASYTYAAIAAEWETWLLGTFRERYEAQKIRVLRQLLHYDDHTAAKIVSREILSDCARTSISARDGDFTPERHDRVVASMAIEQEHIRLEAERARTLCDRVIAGLEQGPEDYAERASDPILEAETSPRFKALVGRYDGCAHVLDLACGPGAFALALVKHNPTVHVTGIDYAAGNIAAAKAAAEQLGVADRVTFLQGAVYDFARQEPCDLWPILPEDRYDGVFVGEFLEHVGDCTGTVDAIERYLVDGSPVAFTVPYGPLGEMIPRDIPHRRGHVHHFAHVDLHALFGQKADVWIDFMPWGGQTARGESCGNWLIAYRTNGTGTGVRPYAQRILTTRPRARLTVGILAKNAEFDLAKCLNSVWGIADEILIGDTGSLDQTVAIATAFDAGYGTSKIRVLHLPAIEETLDGFAGARNALLADAKGDWFFWIDTDEQLLNAHEVQKYLESGPFNGYSIAQVHLTMDGGLGADKPIRLFRVRPDIQFYGCVHEQPQLGDCNGDILPGLEIGDVAIPHLGYLTEGIRRDKMLRRNRTLLVRDQQVFPDRRLGKVLWIREYVNMADLEREENGGALTPKARAWLTQVVAIFEKYFADPADKFHGLSRPFYERALREISGTLEVEIAMAGRHGGLGQAHAKPMRTWVRTYDDLERVTLHRLAEIKQQMTPPPLRVDPYEDLVPARKEEISA